MKIPRRTIAIFAVFAATGLIWAVAVSQPVDAWHSQFATKKNCTNYMTTVQGNTTAEANFMCQKIIPH